MFLVHNVIILHHTHMQFYPLFYLYITLYDLGILIIFEPCCPSCINAHTSSFISSLTYYLFPCIFCLNFINISLQHITLMFSELTCKYLVLINVKARHSTKQCTLTHYLKFKVYLIRKQTYYIRSITYCIVHLINYTKWL